MSSGGLTEGLFSWLNELFAWLFSLGMGGKLNWVTRYWPMLVLIIAVFVVVMDMLVWFIRYRPYRRWKRVMDSLLGRSHTTRPVRLPKEEPPRRARTRNDIPNAPLASKRGKTADMPVTAPLPRARREEEPPTAPRAARAPAKALDVPTVGRVAQRASAPSRRADGAASTPVSAPVQKPIMKAAAPSVPPVSAPPSDDDAPTLRP